MIEEVKTIANTYLKSTLDATTLTRHAWLRESSIKQEVQAAVINMPFTRDSLFGNAVDESLQRKTMRLQRPWTP